MLVFFNFSYFLTFIPFNYDDIILTAEAERFLHSDIDDSVSGFVGDVIEAKLGVGVKVIYCRR